MRAYPVTALPGDLPLPRAGTELTGLLDDALATKLVGVLRCRRHHFMARRGGSMHAVDMFLAHSNAEQDHADALAQRIVELEAEPGFSPLAVVARSHVAFLEPSRELSGMAEEDLEATQATAYALAELVRFVGNRDGVTRRMLLEILAADQMRVQELSALIASLRRQQ